MNLGMYLLFTLTVKDYDDQYQAWNGRVEKLRAERPDVTWEEINETAGICPWPQPMGGGLPFRPFGLYESMVKRVAPYGVNGFWYYQAEEDWSRASYYEKLNQAVIDQWREDLWIMAWPMYIMQQGCLLHRLDVVRNDRECNKIRED